MRLIDAEKLENQYDTQMKKLLSSTTIENVSAEALSLLCGSVLIKNAPTIKLEERWIPCSERLPEEGKNVLGWVERDVWSDAMSYSKKQEYAIGCQIKGLWYFDGYDSRGTCCLAWTPLPKPYYKWRY